MKNLRPLLLVSAFFLSAVGVWAQNYPSVDTAFAWGSGQDHQEYNVYETLKDQQGNYLVMGSFEDDFDIDPGPGVLMATNPHNVDIPYLQKIDADGNLIWARWWPHPEYSQFRDIAVDNQNNIYISGGFSGNAFDVDPISSQFVYGIDSLFGESTISAFLIKLNSQGQLDWGQSVKGGFSSVQALGIQGNTVLMSGIFSAGLDTATGNNSDAFISASGNNTDFYAFRINGQNGDKLDKVVFQGNARAVLTSFAVLPSGDMLFGGGFFDGSLDFNPDPNLSLLEYRTVFGDYRGFLVQLDSSFEYKRHAVFDGTAENRPLRLYARSNNEIWLAGEFSDTLVDLDPGPAISRPSSKVGNGEGMYYIQLDSNFTLQRKIYHIMSWGNPDLNHFNPRIAFKGNDVFVGSTFITNLYLQPNVAGSNRIRTRTSGSQPFNLFSFYLVKVDPSGKAEYLYHPQLGNQNTTSEELSTFFFDDNQLVLSGTFSTELDVDPTLDTLQIQSNSGWGNYIIKLNNCVQDSVPEISRSYGTCDTVILGDTTLTTHGWHYYSHILQNKGGCDSVKVRDSVFVFMDVPLVINQGTYLEAQYQDTLYGHWIDCSTNTVVQGGVDKFYPQQPGDYALVYSHPNAPDCGDTLACETISQISLSEVIQKSWNIYPNPVERYLQLEGDVKDLQAIRILQVNGQEILTRKPQSKIDLGRLPSGAYVLELQTSHGSSRKLFMKQ